nr:uncharacterized abhydrolase domain-containing protein DDB_G0269086-like [Aegilops tauschii subsp. strangulata]
MAGASSSAAPTAPGGATKRRAGLQLQGGRPKKPKGSATATRREEAAAKAARFQRAPKQPQRCLLGLRLHDRGTEGSTNTRRIDPRADLREAREKNAREAREEKERAEQAKTDAAKAAQEEADAAAKAQVDTAAKAREEEAIKAQADAAAKAQAGAAACGQAPQLVILLCSMPPAPGIPAPTGAAGDKQPATEGEEGGAGMSRAEAIPPVPTADVQASRPEAPQAPPVGSELVVGATPVARANATLRQQLGEARTALHAKEEERLKVEQERDRLAKQLADQADKHKAELQKLKDAEEALQAEFETQRSNWVEKEKALSDGYGKIEDLLDEYFPVYTVAASQAVEARRDERRLDGATIAPNAPRTLTEQMLAIQARLQPVHRALRRLQRAEAQVVSALWPGTPVLCTVSRTSDWFVVAIGRIEAWKGSPARAGARRALEFIKGCYPGLNLDQLATLHAEAGEELDAVASELYHHAAAIAEYTDTSVFLLELDEAGAEVLPNWFRLNPEGGEDSVEEIASSDESEEDEDDDEDGKDDAPDDEDESRPQPDQVSTNGRHAGEPTAVDADQDETNQTAVPPPGASTSADPSDLAAAPLA